MNEQKLNKYSDDGLLLSLGGLLDQERKTDRLILLHLLEVSERRSGGPRATIGASLCRAH